MSVWSAILKMGRWHLSITAPRRDKCVICVAPHTSNLDFIVGLAAYSSMGRKANFLMKSFWFFFPLGIWLRHMGGIPVKRKEKGGHLTDAIIERFRTTDYINLAVTPEGTRSRTSQWRTGFLRIAYGAGVPIQLGVIDFAQRTVTIADEYMPTGDMEADMAAVKAYYADKAQAAKYPDKFTV